MSSSSQKSHKNEADIAYDILRAQGRQMNYRHLAEAVLRQMSQPLDAARISSVLTQINLDTRFAYAGHGEWGLKNWVPSRGSKRLPTITLMNKTVAYDDEEDEDKALADELDFDENEYNDDTLDHDEDFEKDPVDEEEDEDEEEESEHERW